MWQQQGSEVGDWRGLVIGPRLKPRNGAVPVPVGARRGGREGRERRRAAEQTATKQTDRAFEGCVRLSDSQIVR